MWVVAGHSICGSDSQNLGPQKHQKQNECSSSASSWETCQCRWVKNFIAWMCAESVQLSMYCCGSVAFTQIHSGAVAGSKEGTGNVWLEAGRWVRQLQHGQTCHTDLWHCALRGMCPGWQYGSISSGWDQKTQFTGTVPLTKAELGTQTSCFLHAVLSVQWSLNCRCPFAVFPLNFHLSKFLSLQCLFLPF